MGANQELLEREVKLIAWLQKKLPNVTELNIANIDRPQGSGYSNDTMLVDISYRQASELREERIVLRVSPTGFPVFPFYDIPQQFDVMQALAANTNIPVPDCLWKEYDKSILGESFYVMRHLDGQVPSDNPPFHRGGFVMDASPKQRGDMWCNGIRQMAELHKLSPTEAGFDFLRWPDSKQSDIAQHLHYYEEYLKWAARGRAQPVADYALQWLKDNMPSDEPQGIVWGDARFGNMMYSGTEVCAVLDWEMVALGNPEADLAWWLFVDECLARGNGNPEFVGSRPDGIPGNDETIALYEQCMGRPVEHLKYYQVFAGFRFACVMIRIMQQQAAAGTIPVEFTDVLEVDNTVTQITAEILGISKDGL
ncbi:MAG: phosphotransferase family protein [Pseudomonadales bacterium]